MDASQIPVLTPTNWSTWKTDMKVLLMHWGCWSFVEVSEDKELKTEEDPEYKPTRRELADERLRKDRAFTFIYQGVRADLRCLLSGITDGQTAWSTLKDHFEPSTRARVIHLLDEFFQTKYRPGEDIGIYISRVVEAAGRLKDAGHELESLYIGFQLIRFLPPEFQPTVQMIYRWKDEDFIPTKIEAELILEQNRLNLMKQDLERTETAFYSRSLDSDELSGKTLQNLKPQVKLKDSKINKRTVAYKSKNVGPCYFCNEYGHLIRNCKSRPKGRNGNTHVKSNYNETVGNLVELEANSISEVDRSCWVLDTAATSHFCNNKDLYYHFEPVDNLQMSLAVGSNSSKIEGTGTICFIVRLGKEFSKITLENVLYNPNLRRNLISGSKMEQRGSHLIGSNGKFWVYDEKWNKLFFAKRRDNLYFLKPTKYLKEPAEFKESSNTISNVAFNTNAQDNVLWHNRFCHINQRYLVSTSNNECVKGLPGVSLLKEDCLVCKVAKAKRISFESLNSVRSKRPLELVHMDVCGPMPEVSVEGYKYFLTVTDDFSRKVTVFPIRNKSDVFDCFKKFQTRAERFLGKKILSVRSDNGLEFCNREFKSLFDELGIRHEYTNTFTPEQNGVSERYNLTAMNGVRSLLESSGISSEFWDEALLCFTYVWNRVCHRGFKKTPFELYCKRKPSVAHLKTFGCLAYVGIPKQKRTKLDMKAKLGIMVGYALRTRGFRIWIESEQKVVETLNVRFDETKRGIEVIKGPISDNSELKCRNLNFGFSMPSYLDCSEEVIRKSSPKVKEVPKIEISEHDLKEDEHEHNLVCSYSSFSGSDDENVGSPTPCDQIPWVREVVYRKDGSRADVYYKIEGSNTRLRSFNDVEKFCSRNNIIYNKAIFDFKGKNTFSGKVLDIKRDKQEANLTEIKVPKDYNSAIQSLNSNEWKTAMNKEINIMKNRKVWKIVDPPKNAKILGCRWVYNIKFNDKNEPIRYKARLVAQGFCQVKGQSFEEVFSPVINFTLIRLFYTIFVSLLKWFHVQLDIDSAYLYADIDEEIYMKQPLGFEQGVDKVCLLQKAIYGLHQSSRLWFFEVDDVLLDLNFEKVQWCNCVYTFNNSIILLLYVDDIVIFGKTETDIDYVITMLKGKFDLKVLGETRKLLGIEFFEQDGKLFIHQKSYINKICKLYDEFKYPIVSLPMVRGCILSKLDEPKTSEELEEMSSIPYRNLLGSLAFISNRTRPDIAFAVNLLSQFQANPGLRHWDCLLKVLGYLKGSIDHKLDLSKIDSIRLTCFADSDYAANRDDRVSIGGYIVFLDRVPVVWRTFKQKSVSLSTMEAEYIALSEAAKEIIWLRNVLVDESLRLTLIECKLLSDNQSAISFSKSPVENHRSKHIDIRYHFLRNLVFDKKFDLKFVKSKDNIADMFTKPVVREQLVKFKKEMFI